ncbi:MAG: rhomboid family intramembrane serine protease [Planctomycetota bacterium]|jgi:membrane associated rhomboid family serine protease
MILFFPYRTDTAVEHGPWGSLGLIAANVAVAVWLGTAGDSLSGSRPVDPWILQYGELNPVTWVTSAFVHGDAFHLVGNMVFLWTFGLVVEGMIGWRRFLPVYFAIIILQGGVEQLMMLGADEGGSFGASGGTSGLMAIAALWAPRTHVCLYVWIWRYVRTLEVTVWGFCMFYLGLEALGLLLSGLAISSELLHLMGAFIGLGIGVLMLRKGWVDCEGWDYLSLREHGRPRVKVRQPVHTPLVVASDTDDPGSPGVKTLVSIREALDDGDPVGAVDMAERAELTIPRFALPREDLERLIAGLMDGEHSERAVPRMEEFLRRFPDESAAMRLTLAAVLVRRRRPSKALEQLDGLPDDALDGEQRAERARLEAQARAALGRGGLELE